jgi:DNA-binding response OmpR family regulator
VAIDGSEGLDKALNNAYDLILLDIMLPIKDGKEVLQELRINNRSTPVLMLTALNSVEDKVEGLNLGADDYLAKPFAFDELVARVRALIRRSTSTKSTKLQCEDLILDSVTHIAYRNGRIIELTSKEYLLLEYLIRHKGKVLSRNTITQYVWKQAYDPESNIIDVYIKRLRNKIDVDGERQLIVAIRGIGYKLREFS